jgi:hypothetical protein
MRLGVSHLFARIPGWQKVLEPSPMVELAPKTFSPGSLTVARPLVDLPAVDGCIPGLFMEKIGAISSGELGVPAMQTGSMTGLGGCGTCGG